MSRFSKIFGLVFMMVLTAGMVFAAWDTNDINKIVDKVKKGERAVDSGQYPGDGIQQVSFHTNELTYLIDIRAKLCYAIRPDTNGTSITPVSCKSIKDGYPLFAPVITWEN